MRAAFKAMSDWHVMQILNLGGAARIVGFRAAYLPCQLSPHLGVVGSPLDLDQGAIAAGWAFQRLWLRATLLDLAIQPMVASAVLALPAWAEGASDRTRRALRKEWDEIQRVAEA